MLDNQLITLIISTIISQEAIAGIAGLPIAQAFQPTQQGVNSEPTAFLFKVADRRVGWPKSYDAIASNSLGIVEGANGNILLEGKTGRLLLEGDKMAHQQLQQYESTFQFSALATQNPATPNLYTASDILNLIAGILQSSTTVATLEAQGVGVQRISDIRNPYFINDKEREQAAPSMDVVFTHKQIILSTSQILQNIEYQILTI